MATTINYNVALGATGDIRFSKTASGTAAQAGADASGHIQEIGTTHELLDIGSDLTTAGWGFFRNLDDTNFLQIGIDVAATFYPLITLEPGEAFIGRLSTTSVYAKADTAACRLDFYLFEA